MKRFVVLFDSLLEEVDEYLEQLSGVYLDDVGIVLFALIFILLGMESISEVDDSGDGMSLHFDECLFVHHLDEDGH